MIPENAKNPTIFSRTIPRLTESSAILVTIVSAMIPRTSSMIAAPRMAFPERVFSFPSSFSVSTVILTDVAVRMTPIKIFCKKTGEVTSDSIAPGLLKNHATA